MIASHILPDDPAFAAKVAAVAAELADLVADGVAVVVNADQVVAAEAQGVILDLLTGKPAKPLLALDRAGVAL
jgi:hypothetical protein